MRGVCWNTRCRSGNKVIGQLLVFAHLSPLRFYSISSKLQVCAFDSESSGNIGQEVRELDLAELCIVKL